MLKPLAVHERMIDSELLRAIEKLDGNLQSLALAHSAALRQIEELQAELLELRRLPDGRPRGRSGDRAAQRPLVGELLVFGRALGRTEPKHRALGAAFGPGVGSLT